jgi:hypothetical protein
MKKVKKYVVESSDTRPGREPKKYDPMTLPELIKYFGYTLEIGHSWNQKIPRNPKTIKSFIKFYNMAIDEKCGGYHRPYLSLIDTKIVEIQEVNDAKDLSDMMDVSREISAKTH